MNEKGIFNQRRTKVIFVKSSYILSLSVKARLNYMNQQKNFNRKISSKELFV